MERIEAEKKRFSIKMRIAKIKKKSFNNVGEKNNYFEKNLKPLQNELITISKF
jgi:hypothetical protein